MASGRRSAEVEFLRMLHELTGLNQSGFARACGKKQSNMAAYLSGRIQPGKKVLESCVRQISEWRVQAIMEIEERPKNLNSLPKVPGMYILYDSAGAVLYLGKATNFRSEVQQTLRRRLPEPVRFGPGLGKKRPYLSEVVRRLSLYKVESERLRHNLEALFLRVFANQTHNSNVGKTK